MSRHNRAAIAVALAAVLLPLAAQAQQNGPPPEVQRLVAEMRQIQAELEPVQQEALQDPALQQEQQAVSDAVREAMVAADPANGERLDRMEAILLEARTAQAAGDTSKVAALSREAADLQPKVEAAQAAAIAQPVIEARIAKFQENLRAKMIELNPAAKERIERLEAISEQLERAVRGNG
jgi:hypothetical protein